jgi:hypothetical protein
MWGRKREDAAATPQDMTGRTVTFSPELDDWVHVPVTPVEDDRQLALWAAKRALAVLGELTREDRLDRLTGILDYHALQGIADGNTWKGVRPPVDARGGGDLTKLVVAFVAEVAFESGPTFEDAYAELVQEDPFNGVTVRETSRVLLPTGWAVRQLCDEVAPGGGTRLSAVRHTIEPASDPRQPFLLLSAYWHGVPGDDDLVAIADDLAQRIRILPAG